MTELDTGENILQRQDDRPPRAQADLTTGGRGFAQVAEANTKGPPLKIQIKRQKTKDNKRTLRNALRLKSAAEAVRGLDRQTEIFGLTKGQFSKIQLIEAIADIVGPCFLTLSSWTASVKDCQTLQQMKDAGKITGARIILDQSFPRRYPGPAAQVRDIFGSAAIMLTVIHAKFCLFAGPGANGWRAVLRTSANLNMNPRTEDYTVEHRPELFAFLKAYVDEIFRTEPPAWGSNASKYRGAFSRLAGPVTP